MNYIKQLNAASEKFFFDDRLNPNHISLYMALFHEWNSSRFAVELFVNRRDLMTASKIASKTTYHKCLKNLEAWNYIKYFPSNNPYKSSKIKMVIIGTSDEPVMEQFSPLLEQIAEQYSPNNEPVVYRHSPKNGLVMDSNRSFNGQALVSNINNTKQVNNIKQPKGWQAVINFFIEKGFDADEGKKFFEYYQARNWQTSNGITIRDWRALAISWIDRSEVFAEKNKQNKKPVSQKRDNLWTSKNKNYGQPL